MLLCRRSGGCCGGSGRGIGGGRRFLPRSPFPTEAVITGAAVTGPAAITGAAVTGPAAIPDDAVTYPAVITDAAVTCPAAITVAAVTCPAAITIAAARPGHHSRRRNLPGRHYRRRRSLPGRHYRPCPSFPRKRESRAGMAETRYSAGILLAPNLVGAVSAAIGDGEVDAFVPAFRRVLRRKA